MAVFSYHTILASSVGIGLLSHPGPNLGALLCPISEHVLAKLVGVHLGSWISTDELGRVKVRLQGTGRLLYSFQ